MLTPIASRADQTRPALRPPAVPLIACDPYFSVWSQADHLTDVDTTHWTGKPQPLNSLVRIDGKTYRVMGRDPNDTPAMQQTSLSVLPTRTIYTFADAGIELSLTFTTPALPDDIDILSRPVTYVTWTLHSTDGASHDVQFYLDASGMLAVNTPDQRVNASIEKMKQVDAAKIGCTEQNILGKRGDDIRIDWGYFYLAADQSMHPAIAIAGGDAARQQFSQTGKLANLKVDLPAKAPGLVAAMVIDAGHVGQQPITRWAMVAYDELYAIQYMKHNLRPYWRRNGWDAADLLDAAAKEHDELMQRCVAFDKELTADLTRDGGADYAKLGSLAYRQCFAAGKFVADDNGQPLQFCKENHSNGCISTSDVFYPMSPQFLLMGPTLAKSFIVPFMNYAASDRWHFPFAPHDLGTYPMANGQRYGGGEHSEQNQMPVEESGNLLILMTAVAEMEGNADFAAHYWPQLQQWARYLKSKGFDPENQLCTDDFAGHLAHNVNLSAKAICALGAYAKLCRMRGLNDEAAEYDSLAKHFARQWVEKANDGDHFRLAFDRPGTWSQKYNLVWDRILGLDLFPDSVREKAMAYYRRIQKKYGLPLDNRRTYTKLDWTLWTATLTQNRDDFEAIVRPVMRFLNETPDRSPMTDWYFTDNARKKGFTARPVVGGVFLQMLYDKPTWHKYASRDQTRASGWAPMPLPPHVVSLLATSQKAPAQWRYTTHAPPADWSKPDFNDHAWAKGSAGFGTKMTPNTVVRTKWDSSDIWIRRSFDLAQAPPDHIALLIHHDEDAEVYINGQRVASLSGFTTDYNTHDIPAASLHVGRNTIAIHCHQTRGGQYIDAGIIALVPATSPGAK